MGRVFHLGVAVIARAVYLWAAAGQRQVSRLPADLPALSYPLRVEGLEAASPAELRFLAQRFPPSSIVHIESAGRILPVQVLPAFPFLHHAITMLTGLIFWAVCFFVFAPLVNRTAAGGVFWGLLGYGLAVMSGGIYCPPEPLWPQAARPLLRIFSLAVVPVLFIHISLLFPRRNPLWSKHRFLLLGYALATGLAAWRGTALID